MLTIHARSWIRRSQATASATVVTTPMASAAAPGDSSFTFSRTVASHRIGKAMNVIATPYDAAVSRCRDTSSR